MEKEENTIISAQAITDIREEMLKFARLQVRDANLAEDLVQEALLSSLRNVHQFQRKAALKTWVFAILKNKIIDYLRQKDRFMLESELVDDDRPNNFFDEKAHWNLDLQPTPLPEAETKIYSKEFWLLFEVCLTHLPAKQARAFMMREYLELSSEEVCAEMTISSANLYTLLYRARLQLQHCLTRKLGTE